jgi:hypothetical protein
MTRAVSVSETTPSLVTPHHTRPTPGLLPSWAPSPAPLSRSGCQATTSRTPQVGLAPPSARSSACTGTSCSSKTAPRSRQWHSPRSRPRRRRRCCQRGRTPAASRRLPRTMATASSSYHNSTAFIWHSSAVRCPPRRLPALRTSSPSPSSLPSAVSVRTFLKVYMELGSYFLFLQEQIKDIIRRRGAVPWWVGGTLSQLPRAELERPLIADTRIAIVIRPYLLRWQRREESITNLHSRPE